MRGFKVLLAVACSVCVALPCIATAQDRASPREPAPAAQGPRSEGARAPVGSDRPTVPLQPLLDRVARESHKQFLVDGRVPPDIYLGGAHADEINYPLLLSILRINNLASVEVEGRINIVPEGEIRWYATRILNQDDKSVAADEFVTRLVTLQNIGSAFVVPILRPLMPQAAHLAAFPPHDLIIMDRYANVQRIMALLEQMDRPGAGVVPNAN